MDLLEQMQKIAMWESSLASCAIEGNSWADKHLKMIEKFSLSEKYIYLQELFGYLEEKYK